MVGREESVSREVVRREEMVACTSPSCASCWHTAWEEVGSGEAVWIAASAVVTVMQVHRVVEVVRGVRWSTGEEGEEGEVDPGEALVSLMVGRAEVSGELCRRI